MNFDINFFSNLIKKINKKDQSPFLRDVRGTASHLGLFNDKEHIATEI